MPETLYQYLLCLTAHVRHSSCMYASGAERRVQAVKAFAPPTLRSRNRQAGAAQAIQARAAGACAQVARDEPCRGGTPPGAAIKS